MSVVVDTNVLVSGVFFRGAPFKLVQSWLDHRFEVFVTAPILEEYLRLIEEMGLIKASQFQYDWSVVLPETCYLIDTPASAGRLCRDPDDDKFLLCALHAHADYLVSGDADLRILNAQFPFSILSPRSFLSVL